MRRMLSAYLPVVLRIAFTVLMTCVSVTVISGIYLYLFKLRRANEVMQHPYLKHAPFDRLPVGVRAAILLDYFFRLAMPRSQFWLVGHANRQLAHVNPDKVPVDVKWPILGFWGGCWLGIVAMLVLWLCLFLGAAA
jgi:hypothetical protein